MIFNSALKCRRMLAQNQPKTTANLRLTPTSSRMMRHDCFGDPKADELEQLFKSEQRTHHIARSGELVGAETRQHTTATGNSSGG